MIEAPNTDSFEESDTTSEEKVLVKMGKKGHQWSKPNMFCVSLGDLLDVKDSAKHLSDHKINIPLNETAKTFIKEFVHEILETDDEKFLKNGRINFSLKAQKEYVEEKFKTFKSSLESDFDALNPIYVQKMEDENKRRKRKINKKNDFYEIAKVEFYEIFSRILADKIVHVIHSRKIPFPEIKTTEQEAVSNYVMMNGKVQSDKNPVRDINETGQLTKQGHFRTRVIEPFTYKVISKSFRTHVMGAAGELIPISPYTAWTDPRLKNRFCGYIFTLIKDYLLKGAYIATWRREFLDDDLFLLTLKRRIGVGKFSIEATLEFLKYAKDIHSASANYFIPCAGYGERLVGGFLEGSVKQITALDTDAELCRAYTSMFNAFSKAVPALKDKKLKVIQKPIEDTALAEIGVQDCVFSCPPYRRFQDKPEDYVEAGDKSTNQKHCAFRYRENLAWIEKFFYPLIRKSFGSLRAGGVFGFMMNKPLNDLLLKMLASNPQLQTIDGMPAQHLKTVGFKYNSRNSSKVPQEEMILLRRLTDLRMPSCKTALDSGPLKIRIAKPKQMQFCSLKEYFKAKTATQSKAEKMQESAALPARPAV